MPTEQVDDNSGSGSGKAARAGAATNTEAELLGSVLEPSKMANPDQESNDKDSNDAVTAAGGTPASLSRAESEFVDPFVARPPPPSSIAYFGLSMTTELKPDDSITYIGVRMATRNASRPSRRRRRRGGGVGSSCRSSSRLSPLREIESLAT